jgi:hypothetical protein
MACITMPSSTSPHSISGTKSGKPLDSYAWQSSARFRPGTRLTCCFLRQILAEALRIARAASDRAALEKCLSLARRLEAATGSSSTVGRGALAGAAFSAEAEPFERLCASDQLFLISHLFSRVRTDTYLLFLRKAPRLNLQLLSPLQGTPLPEIQRLVYQSLGTLDREEFPPDETTPQAAQGQMPPRALDPAGGQKGKVPPPVKQDVENGAWESLVGGVWAAMGAYRS